MGFGGSKGFKALGFYGYRAFRVVRGLRVLGF